MEKLSLDAINAKSEYYVKKEDDEGTYSFTTDNMTEFFISFEKDDILRSGIVYQFGIFCKREEDAALDSRSS